MRSHFPLIFPRHASPHHGRSNEFDLAGFGNAFVVLSSAHKHSRHIIQLSKTSWRHPTRG